jgi:DNA-binding transcriptional LysR family regulator
LCASPLTDQMTDKLRLQGIKTSPVLRTSMCMVAPFVAAQSDVVFILPKREALSFARFFQMRTAPLPVPPQKYDTFQYWAERSDHDGAHRWLRKAVKTRSECVVDSREFLQLFECCPAASLLSD